MTLDEHIDHLEHRLARWWRETLEMSGREHQPPGELFRTIMLLEEARKRRATIRAKADKAA